MDPGDKSGQLISVADLRSILEDSLPQEEIVYAFAYGSGVLSQRPSSSGVEEKAGNNNNNNLIDFIVVVQDAYRFHQANLSLNPHHYAGPFVLSADRAARITWWQRHVAFGLLSDKNPYFRNPGVYFNRNDW